MTYGIGLMTGTSLDGIDVTILDISEDSTFRPKIVAFQTYPYESEILAHLKLILDKQSADLHTLSCLNVLLGKAYGQAVLQLCEESQIDIRTIDYIASHGQTLYHQPDTAVGPLATMQIGESAMIAEMTNKLVVSNFREADMAAGGQGAPIVPFTEYLLFSSRSCNRMLQNIGGIGNLTFIPKNASLNEVQAFDTGPGNMVINELMQHFYRKSFDKNGQIAAAGTVHWQVVNRLMELPYIQKAFPKTTGRELFGKNFVKQLLQQFSLQPSDWIATATMFTAKSIIFHAVQLTQEPAEIIIGGGGAYNTTLIQMIKELAGSQFIVKTQEEIGYPSDAKEAVAIALLGYYTLKGQSNNVPSATGAHHPVILGKITLPPENHAIL